MFFLNVRVKDDKANSVAQTYSVRVELALRNKVIGWVCFRLDFYHICLTMLRSQIYQLITEKFVTHVVLTIPKTG